MNIQIDKDDIPYLINAIVESKLPTKMHLWDFKKNLEKYLNESKVQ